MDQFATQYSSLKFDADDEISSVKIDTLHVNYAQTDYLLSYTATLQRQNPSALGTKIIHDPSQSYSMIPHYHWKSQQKSNPANETIHSMFPQPALKKQNDSKN